MNDYPVKLDVELCPSAGRFGRPQLRDETGLHEQYEQLDALARPVWFRSYASHCLQNHGVSVMVNRPARGHIHRHVVLSGYGVQRRIG
jgi:hypothetical protein